MREQVWWLRVISLQLAAITLQLALIAALIR